MTGKATGVAEHVDERLVKDSNRAALSGNSCTEDVHRVDRRTETNLKFLNRGNILKTCFSNRRTFHQYFKITNAGIMTLISDESKRVLCKGFPKRIS